MFRKNTTLIRKYPNGTYVLQFPDQGMLLIFTRFDRLADAPIDDTTKKRVKKYDIIDGDGLAMAGERVDPGDVYVNKQTPTNANDNTTVSAVAAGFKNTPLTYKAPVSGYIDKVRSHRILKPFAQCCNRLCSPIPKMIKSSSKSCCVRRVDRSLGTSSHHGMDKRVCTLLCTDGRPHSFLGKALLA